MKKFFSIIIMIIILTIFYNQSINIKNDSYGVNIFEFKDKVKNLDNIYYICTYDFCDYLRNNSIDKSLEIFMKKYLDTINDEEIKNTLKAKGIIIKKIIYKD